MFSFYPCLRASVVKAVLGALVSWWFMGSSAFGQPVTSGADFLRIDSGARSEGMGGAFTAVSDDVNALTWNPAGLALLQHPEVGYLRMIYLSDISYNFGGVALPIPDGENTIGLGGGVVNLGVPAFDSTLGIADPVSAGDNAFFISGAYRIKNIVSFGITGKYIMRNVAGYNASAFGGDVGVLVTPGDRLRIGAGVFNVGQSVQFVAASDPLPTIALLGLAYEVVKVPHHSLLVSAETAYDLGSQSDAGAAGLEYWFDQVLAVRGGYAGDVYQQHWTAGLGINLNIFQMDYAYAPLGTIGDTHRLSLILRFGTDMTEGLLAPAGFAAKPIDEGLSLSWKPSVSPNVVGYNLYVKKPGADSFMRVTPDPIHVTAVKLKHLVNGQNYAFEVSSVSAAGRESSPVQLAAIPGAIVEKTEAPLLSPPMGFKAAPKGEGVELTWDRSAASNVVGYNLYFADEQGKTAQKLSKELIVDNRVVLKKVNSTLPYRFIVAAVDKTGLEAGSTVLVVKLADLQQPAAHSLGEGGAQAPVVSVPGQFNIVGGNGSANLSWAEVTGVAGFNLYSSDDGKSFKLLTPKAPRKSASALLSHLKNGKTYYFAVTSVTTDGKESDKAVQKVIPAAN